MVAKSLCNTMRNRIIAKVHGQYFVGCCARVISTFSILFYGYGLFSRTHSGIMFTYVYIVDLSKHVSSHMVLAKQLPFN